MSPLDTARNPGTQQLAQRSSGWQRTSMQIDDSLFGACNFMPWIGPEYWNTGALDGLRVLVLGESHYRWKPPPPRDCDATRVVMEAEIAGTDPPHPCHARVVGAMLGVDDARARGEITRFWNAVAFYNYVQEYVGDRSGVRPTKAAWQSGEAALPIVLAALRPHFVLACGSDLYNHVAKIDGLTDSPEHGTDALTRSREIVTFYPERGIIGMMYHPAYQGGFATEQWRIRVLAYIGRAHALKAALSE
jgi:hypothetical protein